MAGVWPPESSRVRSPHRIGSSCPLLFLYQVFEIRTTDDLTETWLKEKLAFFR